MLLSATVAPDFGYFGEQLARAVTVQRRSDSDNVFGSIGVRLSNIMPAETN
jgi:hypothetical protein